MQVLYDSRVVSFKEVIRHYLKAFRPRRSESDKFSQYRAAIFYDGEQQKREAAEVLEEVGFDKRSRELLLEPAATFYAAEEYHQKYYNKMCVPH